MSGQPPVVSRLIVMARYYLYKYLQKDNRTRAMQWLMMVLMLCLLMVPLARYHRFQILGRYLLHPFRVPLPHHRRVLLVLCHALRDQHHYVPVPLQLPPLLLLHGDAGTVPECAHRQCSLLLPLRLKPLEILRGFWNSSLGPAA